jgi:argininosuccinate synthase
MIPPFSLEYGRKVQEWETTFEKDQVYVQGDATGFIRLNGLRLKINAMQAMQ